MVYWLFSFIIYMFNIIIFYVKAHINYYYFICFLFVMISGNMVWVSMNMTISKLTSNDNAQMLSL